MDDFIIFTKTRWHLRKAVKKLNQFFNQFSFKQHPDKTFIGKIDKGFDWMGFQITLQGIVDIAPRSMEKLILKLAQLYEQNQPLTPIVRALNYFVLYVKCSALTLPNPIAYTICWRTENIQLLHLN